MLRAASSRSATAMSRARVSRLRRVGAARGSGISAHHAEAAVHRQRLARDEAGCLTREKQHGACHFHRRAEALQRRAQWRGFSLPDDTADYLLARVGRDTGSLFRLLDRLDRAALAAQRRLTIPFVRSVLEAGE